MAPTTDLTSHYQQVGDIAHDPPGGIPHGWRFLDLSVYAIYDPDEGEWWNAAAEYVRTDRLTGTRRLIGGGPSVRAALHALHERLDEPLTDRLEQSKGGWDTNWEPGRIHERP